MRISLILKSLPLDWSQSGLGILVGLVGASWCQRLEKTTEWSTVLLLDSLRVPCCMYSTVMGLADALMQNDCL